MSIVQTQWWCLELPEEWTAKMDDDSVTIADCDRVSEVDITVIRKQSGQVNEGDLDEFAGDLRAQGLTGEAVTLNAAQGLLFQYDDEDGAWREWFLAAESLMIYITHNSAIEDKGLDNAVVDDILSTLVTLDDEALAED
ncbi:MAG: hypothetical protein VX231_03245 [Pseudomonadota bacterium]|nr:hypothetical protein [Pseudomonadota bacterium]